ncbi:MAG: SulP family inorganic anion transporter [Acidimicrobiia bacterium]|nr:SulP family inorganic anion transporter [Acidimicrobiia bacterium]
MLQGILPVERARVPADIAAGVTLAALGIPEVMGYANIAGMPVITGLYTIVLPIAVFALLGSSRHLVVGADSATAAIMAAGLAGMAPVASPQYVELAGMLAIITGVILILARIVRLGFLADFLSRSVLIGFLTGVGIQVAMGQLAGMLGVPEPSGSTIRKFVDTLGEIPDTNTTTLLVSLSVLAVILGCRKINRRIPGALIAVVGAIFVSWNWDLAADGVSTLGKVPSGLPSLGVPSVTWTEFEALLATAGAIFLVILAQSAATSRAYAAKYGESFDENIDLDGLSAANLAAGLSGTFVVNGSPTKTQMVDGAGGKSQLASMTTAVIVVVVLLFLTKPLQYMPNAVLASVVFLIGIELVDVAGMRGILRVRLDEFAIACGTALIVICVGVEQGIVVAVVVSVIDHLRRGYHPHDAVLVRRSSGGFKAVDVAPGVATVPGLVVYRFTASLYYANATRFHEEILELVDSASPKARWLCIDCTAIADVDYSGERTIRDLHAELAGRGVQLKLVEVLGDVRAQLDRYGITELVGPAAYFDETSDAVEAFATDHGTDESTP